MAKASRSSRIEQSPRGGPQPHADPHRPATGRAEGDDRCRVDETRGLAPDGVCRQEHQAEGVGRDGPAGMHHAAVADFPKAVGQAMREEPPEKLNSGEASGAWTCTAGCAGGEGHGAVRARDDTALGDRPFADIRGEVWQGGGGVWSGLAVDVPGARPDPCVDLLQPFGCDYFLFPHGSGNGGEGCHEDKAVSAGGPPSRAVRCEAAARDDVMEVGVVRELSSPGMQATGKTREICTDETLVFGEPCACLSRGCEQGLGSEALMRAEKRAQGRRDGEGEEEVGSGKRGL